MVPPENILVVTSNEYSSIVAQQLPELPKENILSEPARKNTAPCIAYVSFKIFKRIHRLHSLLLPPIIIILDVEEFHKVCKQALDFVNHINGFITLGMKPTYPNTAMDISNTNN
jgi:mannose-1-phosphate guanylyltransferase